MDYLKQQEKNKSVITPGSVIHDPEQFAIG